MIPSTITDRGVTVFIDGAPRSFATDHPSFTALVDAIDAGDDALIRELADVRATIKTRTFGRVVIQDNTVRIDGRQVTGALVNRILEMVARGSAALEGYVRFLDNLHTNPSKRAVDELWGFIAACDLPVTSDGCFLAYRFVNSEYRDCHSRTVFQKPADLLTEAEAEKYAEPVIGGMRNEVTSQVVDGIMTITMPRNMVNEDKDQTCSEGLHFCSYNYLPSYAQGRRVLTVKINPADVVAIPSDYDNAKGRTCAYTVVSEIDNWHDTRITPFYTDEYEQDDEDEYDEDFEGDYEDDEILDIPVAGEDDEVPVEAYETATPAPVPTPGGPTLNAAQVSNIKALLRDRPDLTMTAIANAYGVHRETIARIRDGRSWPDVQPHSRAIWPVRFGS